VRPPKRYTIEISISYAKRLGKSIYELLLRNLVLLVIVFTKFCFSKTFDVLMFKVTLTNLVLIFTSLVLDASVALACSCAHEHYGARRAQSQFIFLARVLSIAKGEPQDYRNQSITFEVKEQFKGEVPNKYNFANRIESNCSTYFQEKKLYLVFLEKLQPVPASILA